MARAEPGPTIDYTIFQAAILSAIKRLDDPSGKDVLRHLEKVYPEQLNHSDYTKRSSNSLIGNW